MRVYIAGPIAGRVNGNREAFATRADLLRQMSHEPVNPWDILPDHDPRVSCSGSPIYGELAHRYGCFLRADIKVMMDCDAITLLPGWEWSTGATAEELVARAIGLKVVEIL